MEWIFYIIIVFCLIDIESKINKFIKNNSDHKKYIFVLKNYIGKKVILNIENDEITDSHLFSSISDTVGQIIEYDDQWLLFRYYNKNKRKTIDQYIRISDITSIDEIKE